MPVPVEPLVGEDPPAVEPLPVELVPEELPVDDDPPAVEPLPVEPVPDELPAAEDPLAVEPLALAPVPLDPLADEDPLAVEPLALAPVPLDPLPAEDPPVLEPPAPALPWPDVPLLPDGEAGDAVAPLEAVLGPFANDPSWAIIIGPALKALAVTVGCALTEAALELLLATPVRRSTAQRSPSGRPDTGPAL